MPTSNSHLTDLTGKVAIVTGGAMGIGWGISYRLAEAGAKVVIADLKKEAAEAAVQHLRGQNWDAYAVQADVSTEADVTRLTEETVAKYGGIDILVNNAGIYPSVPMLKESLETFEKVLAVNLKSIFLTTKAVSQAMIKAGNGGKIINITSIDAIHPSMVGLSHYDASKHGAWGFTKNVALELAPHKIWVNAVAPGGINTPGVKDLQGKTPTKDTADQTKMVEAFLAKIPMHRMGEPDDIGKVVLFLASEMSSYLTGTQIVVDGGALLS